MSFPAVVELSSLDGSTGFQINGEVANDRSGYSVAAAGDVNGDGYADVIIGAWGADPNGSESGASYVIFGSAAGFAANFSLSSLDGTNGFQINASGAGDNSGYSVASAGDVNGDGYDDLIIGARGADPVFYASGAAYVVFGKASGFTANVSLTTLDGTNGFRLSGGAPFERAGVSVSSAGDVNGDGYDDMIVGASGADNSTGRGFTYVVFGQATGFAANLDLATLNGTNGFRLRGEASYDLSGQAVAGAGDVNGDGYDDIIVGATGNDLNAYGAGAAYVVFGAAGGFGSVMNLSDLYGANGFKISGAAYFDGLGSSVASAGDVNGDGYDDVIVGAANAPYDNYAGYAYVIFGSGFGFAGNIDVSSLNGFNGFRIAGEVHSDHAGRSVSGAGDLNGDGYDDLIVGAYGADPHGGSSGAAYVVYGRASGFPAHLALSTLDGTGGFQISGESGNNRAGISVAGAGDFNGDGTDDLIIGAFGVSSFAGASYIVFGPPPPVVYAGTTGDDAYTGGSGVDQISGGDGKDNLDGGGGDDEIDGGAGNDTLNGGAGADDIVGGLGNDILNGGDGNDVLTDATGSNKLNGGNGDDQIFGASGADRLNGENDDDELTGGAGNDYLDGGSGANTMAGGIGNDIFIVRSSVDAVTEAGGEGTDTVRSMISYTLGANLEVLELLTGTNINGTGNSANNTVRGNGGANTLSGMAGADTLEGGAGNDILIGGVGRDQLWGGAGADTFRVLQESMDVTPLEIDTVGDYDAAEDRLDFSLIDANSLLAGDQAFTVSTTGLQNGVAGRLFVFYTASGDVTTVRLDIDGDGVTDYQMAIKGNVTGDTADWLL